MTLTERLEILHKELRKSFCGQNFNGPIFYIGRYQEQEKLNPPGVILPAILTEYDRLTFTRNYFGNYDVEGFLIVRLLTYKGTSSFADKDLDGLKLLDNLLSWFTNLNSNYENFYDLHSLEKIHEDWRVPSNITNGKHKYLRNYDIWKIVLKVKWNESTILDDNGNDVTDEEINEKRGISIDKVNITNMVGLTPFIMKEPTTLDLSNITLKTLLDKGGLVNNFSVSNDLITIKLNNDYANN